eukprot:TRINITY_DN567_c0_g1_i1.p1 TRINITY_DN567_c0_g1~~TRINITY_DN567_c0_g1_i1.p1  ORF type:complete len:226 (-),score=40.30 TRINITY_DN567_c0_g1_i1:26-703(-)
MGKCITCSASISTFLDLPGFCVSCAGFRSPIQRSALEKAVVGNFEGAAGDVKQELDHCGPGKCLSCGCNIKTLLGLPAWCSSCAGFTSPIQKDSLNHLITGKVKAALDSCGPGTCIRCGDGIETLLGLPAYCESCAGFRSPIQKETLNYLAAGQIEEGLNACEPGKCLCCGCAIETFLGAPFVCGNCAGFYSPIQKKDINKFAVAMYDMKKQQDKIKSAQKFMKK